MVFGGKRETTGSRVHAAWDDYVARPETWSPRDVSAVGKVGELGADGLDELKREFAATLDRVLATPEPLPALREAIMDATDRFVLAEQHHGDDRLTGVLEAGALRRFSKLEFKDVTKDDWYSHYLQVAEMNCRNVAELIRKTVAGEQGAFEESLREPLTRTMQQVRKALLRYPSRVPVERADDLVSSQNSIRVTPNRNQIDRLTRIMGRRFEKLFAGQMYRLKSGPALNPTGTFQIDAGLLFTLLSLHFRRPTDAWREIMSESLGPYQTAMQNETRLLEIGEALFRAWKAPGDGPLNRALARAHSVAFGADPAANTIDAATFVSQASEDAAVLVGEILTVIDER